MLTATGLYGHMRRNAVKSALLLGGFAGLIVLTWYAWCIIYVAVLEGWFHGGMAGHRATVTITSIFDEVTKLALLRWWMPLLFTASWFLVAYLVHSDLIRLATRACPLERRDAPKLYNLVENLAITAGLPMPRIDMIATPARNAFASGLDPSDACITVTSGLLRALTDDELAAVLAHEMTHIKNGDVRLLVVATVFAGGLTLVGNGIAKAFERRNETVDDLYYRHGSDYQYGAGVRNDGRGLAADALFTAEGANPIAIIASLAIGILFLAMAHVSALMIKFAISRSREFLADAGAVELTKNPDALISALQKIGGHDEIPGLSPNMQAMMISASADGLFSTHPPLENRIFALQQYAGGRFLPAPRVVPASSDGDTRPMAAPSAANAQFLPSGAMAISGGRSTFGKRSPVYT